MRSAVLFVFVTLSERKEEEIILVGEEVIGYCLCYGVKS